MSLLFSYGTLNLVGEFPDEFPIVFRYKATPFQTLPMLMPICSSNLKRRDALKILGCTLCDKKMNMHGAIEAWKAAVSLPLSSDEDEYVINLNYSRSWQFKIQFCSETFKVPEVYGKIKEVETMDDVLAIEGQPEVIHMMVGYSMSLQNNLS